MPHPRLGGLLVALALVVSLIVLPGCGDDEPTADVGFTTAEGLLACYDEVCMRPAVVDPRPVLELYYAENETQQRILDVMRAAIPIQELDQALWDTFGSGIDPDAGAPPLAPNRTAAEIVTSVGDRSSAHYVAHDGSVGTLFLVRVGERWWLSGHTLEPDVDPGTLDAHLAARERLNAYVGALAPDIRRRVENGDFRTSAEAGFELGRAVASAYPEIRDVPNVVFGR